MLEYNIFYKGVVEDDDDDGGDELLVYSNYFSLSWKKMIKFCDKWG